MGLADRKQARVKIGAVKGKIGRAITLLRLAPERHGGEPRARAGIEQRERLGSEGGGFDRGEGAELLQGPRRIGPELDAGPGLVDVIGALEQGCAHPAFAERDGCREAANAAANDEHAASQPRRRHREGAQASGALGGAVATKTQAGGSLSAALSTGS